MKVLIVGGTGTLGTALLRHYYEREEDIICFSRDELKQQNLKKRFPNVNYVIGDIRDGIHNCDDKIDIIYHVAALKHIDVLEKNIMEAMKTNIQGTVLTAQYALDHKIPKMAFSSTDKAVFPINVYGYTKALSEKYLQQLNKIQETTKFRLFRWGNVIGSRGSVVETFKRSILKDRCVYLTHPDMTRFWIRIQDAVKFMVNETQSGTRDAIVIPPMKAAKVENLALAIAEKIGCSSIDIKITELRPGEKIHEHITHDKSSEHAEKYTHKELLDLLEGVV